MILVSWGGVVCLKNAVRGQDISGRRSSSGETTWLCATVRRLLLSVSMYLINNDSLKIQPSSRGGSHVCTEAFMQDGQVVWMNLTFFLSSPEATSQVSGSESAYFPKDQDCLTTQSQLRDSFLQRLNAELQVQGVQGQPKNACLVCGWPRCLCVFVCVEVSSWVDLSP